MFAAKKVEDSFTTADSDRKPKPEQRSTVPTFNTPPSTDVVLTGTIHNFSFLQSGFLGFWIVDFESVLHNSFLVTIHSIYLPSFRNGS